MQEITDGSAKFRVVDRRLKAMIDILYPVGIVVTTATDGALKPGEVDRLAQWEEIAQDRILQGVSSGAGGTIEAGLPNIKGGIMTGDGNSGVTSVFGTGGKHNGALYVDRDKNFSNDAYAAPAGTETTHSDFHLMRQNQITYTENLKLYNRPHIKYIFGSVSNKAVHNGKK